MATLTDANLSQVNFSGAVFAACTGDELRPGCAAATFDGANLTDAILTDAVFAASVLVGDQVLQRGATLTGANFTGTILVPSNQSVTATSQAGAVVHVVDATDDPGGGLRQLHAGVGIHLPAVLEHRDLPGPRRQRRRRHRDVPGERGADDAVLHSRPRPLGGAVLAGAPYLDALTADAPGVTSVVFEVTGGTLSDDVVATATPTIYGWLAKWDTTSVPNGTYSLQSVATDADHNTDTSTAVSITVNNPLPTTSIAVPSMAATLSGSTYLDASASNATSVEFRLFGGSFGYDAPVLCTATLTYYGWLCSWDTTTVPDGSYTLLSEAFNSAGNTFSSSGVRIKVNN